MAVSLILAWLALASPATAATTYRVTRPDESPLTCTTNNCSLRAAVNAVNAGSGGDTILLAADTYTLVDDAITISKDVEIAGVGARASTITTSGSSHRIMVIGADVELRDLRLTGARVTADGAAATVNAGHKLTVRRVGVDNNVAWGSAGSAFGGGFNVLGTLDVVDSVMSGNAADPPVSGASWGGAVATRAGGTSTITNSTIAGNKADTGSSTGNGGGLYTAASGTTTVVSSTVAGNSALSPTPSDTPRGGNIYNQGTTTLRNTIVSGGAAAQGAENCFGAIASLGYNIAATDECALSGPGDRQGLDPALGALANNGGPTDTMAIATTSPAFDGAPAAGCPATDQRGIARPQGVGCDIGAFEAEVAVVVEQPTPPLPDPIPDVTALAASPPTFVLGNFLPAASQRRRVGTTLLFTLSEPAMTTLTFAQSRPGRRIGGRCVKPRRGNRRRPRCKRTVTAGSRTFQLAAGERRIRFSGRLSRRKRLRPGRYGLIVRAVDASGQASEPERTRIRALGPRPR
jgi:hypothetical protein